MIQLSDDRLYSPPQAQKTFGIPADTLRRLIAAGKLPAVNVSIGSEKPRWKVRESDLREFLTPACKRQPQQAQPEKPKDKPAKRSRKLDDGLPKVF